MIVCHCRNIKTTDYETEQELIERLMENDVDCGTCLLLYQDKLDFFLLQEVFDNHH